MLVLTRKVGEQIHLGDEIVVTVTSVSGQQVRLGIAAPPEIAILRNELIARAEASDEEKTLVGGKRSRNLRMFRPRVQQSV